MAKINEKIFRGYDVRGRYPQEINEKAAYRLGRAFAMFKKAKKIVIARDLREESKKILPFFIGGAGSLGAEIYDLGVNSTSALSFAVKAKKMNAGAIATASHNPRGYAGLKLIDEKGISIGFKTGLQKIMRLAQKIEAPRMMPKIKVKKIGVESRYVNFIFSLVDLKKLKSAKLVLDASGGSGAKIAKYVFDRLPVKTVRMNFQSGDKYLDHSLNPMLAASQRLAKKAVQEKKADLGLIWDGDGDRVIFIDDRGEFVNPYHLNCLLSEIVLQSKKKIGIVIDARLVLGISVVIKNAGGKPIINEAGSANIIKTMQKKKLLFGCENSGHYYFNFRFKTGEKENFVFSDAILPALMVLEYLKVNRLSLSEAIARFKERYFISGELNFKVNDFAALADKTKVRYRGCKMSKVDGLSVFGPDWFFNLRPSRTEPLARVNIEAEKKSRINEIKQELRALGVK